MGRKKIMEKKYKRIEKKVWRRDDMEAMVIKKKKEKKRNDIKKTKKKRINI